jgi:hypothetical protein
MPEGLAAHDPPARSPAGWRKVRQGRGFRWTPADVQTPEHLHVELDVEPTQNMVAELDHRTSGSVEVSLFWNRATNALFVQVIDWSSEDDFSIAVSPGSARQVFDHPFAYAGICG